MLRNYQKKIAEKSIEILRKLKILYLAIEMRVGKTIIALEIAKLYDAKKVLFVTKKKAIQSIQNDYNREKYQFEIDIINFEQLHKYKNMPDFVIVDEAHSIGAFPKPNLRTKKLKGIVGNNPLILLSGTPNPESFSQLYHQFYISAFSPFIKFQNFYKFAYVFVNIKKKYIKNYSINDYSDCKKELIKPIIEPYFITYTQKEANFIQSEIIEKLHFVNINPKLKNLINLVLREKYFKFKDGNEIICDSAVKLQTKIHQLYSGTVKCENGSLKILDTSKIDYIQQKFHNHKIAIFYKFIAEGKILKKSFPNWTDSPEVFENEKDKIFISQIQSGSMGISLKSADYLIFYNIDFSATQYFQARARLQDKTRTKIVNLAWIFTLGGIENKIYRAVLSKRDYTTYYFRKDFLNGNIGKEFTDKNTKISSKQQNLFG